MDKNDRRRSILTTHSVEKILKELGQADIFHFPPAIETKHGDFVNDESFHQMCRYGVVPQKDKPDREKEYENELFKIAEWLEEVI